MRSLLLAAALGCAACPGGKPPENPPPVEGQLSKPISIGTDVGFDGDSALITLTTAEPAELGWSPGGSDVADKVTLTRDGAAWKGRLDNLPRNDEGTFVVQLGEGETRSVFMFEWSHASALEAAESGLTSADGLLELGVEQGMLPAGARLGVLARPATKLGKTLVLGPYQVSATQTVHAHGVLSLPPEPNEKWSRWNFSSAQVRRSSDGAPYSSVPSVTHPDQGRITFAVDAPASFVLVIEEAQP